MSTPTSAMASASTATAASAATAASTTPVTSGAVTKTDFEQRLSIIDLWKAHIPMFQTYVINVIEKRKRGESATMQLLLPTDIPVTIYDNPNTIVSKIELDCAWFNTARIEQPLRMALRLHFKATPEESQNDPDSGEMPDFKFQESFQHLAQRIGTDIEEPAGSGKKVHIYYVHVDIGLHLLDHLLPLFNHLVTQCEVPSELINRLQDPSFYRPLSAAEKTFYLDVLTAFRRSKLDHKEIGELAKRAQSLDADFSKSLLDRNMKHERISGMVAKKEEFSSEEHYEGYIKDGKYFTSISSATYTLGKLCFEFKALDLALGILNFIKKQDALYPSANWINIQMLCKQCDESQTAENRQKRRMIFVLLSDCDHPEAQPLHDRLTELHYGCSSEKMQQTMETTKDPFFVKLRENPDSDPGLMNIITMMENIFPVPAASATAAAAKSGSTTPSTLSDEAFAKQGEAQRLQKENTTLDSIALMVASATAAAAANKPATDTATASATTTAASKVTAQPVNAEVDLSLVGHFTGTAAIRGNTGASMLLSMFDTMRATSINQSVSSAGSAGGPAHYQPSTTENMATHVMPVTATVADTKLGPSVKK